MARIRQKAGRPRSVGILIWFLASELPLVVAASAITSSSQHLHPRQAAGSGCGGSEGQWNCMGSSWQRCADGIWSVEMPSSDGTICSPSGLHYDIEILHSEEQGDNDGEEPDTSHAALGPSLDILRSRFLASIGLALGHVLWTQAIGEGT